MPKTIRLRRGLDIKLPGAAQAVIENIDPKFFALKPTDFIGVTPRLLVKEGDKVKAGTALFQDKNHEKHVWTSPVSGTVIAINRGEKRLLEEIVIEADTDQISEKFPVEGFETFSKEKLGEVLMKSGLWPCIRQRPYSIVARLEDKPKAIVISAFDTAPLAPDIDFLMIGLENYFQTGLMVLSKLEVPNIYLNVHEKLNTSQVFAQAVNVEVNVFSGPHPSGTVGVQIHHLNPINKGEVVWYIHPVHVAWIGKLFQTGTIDFEIKVAVTGSEVNGPCYVNIRPGAELKAIINNKVATENVRYISGNPLTGTRLKPNGFMSFYDFQLTVLPEGNKHEFLGWAMPGFNKFSFSKTFFSWLRPKKVWKLDTNLHGGERPFVVTGLYEKVLPMDIYPMQLLKAIIIEDIDLMENLGIYEVSEEEFALCEFVDPSKTEMQSIIRKGLDLIRKEMN